MPPFSSHSSNSCVSRLLRTPPVLQSAAPLRFHLGVKVRRHPQDRGRSASCQTCFVFCVHDGFRNIHPVSVLALCVSVELLSVAAALLHQHVLVMPHDHLAVLKVEHGEWSQAGGDAGQTRHRVGTVQLQQALQGGTGKSSVRSSVWLVCPLWGHNSRRRRD